MFPLYPTTLLSFLINVKDFQLNLGFSGSTITPSANCPVSPLHFPIATLLISGSYALAPNFKSVN